MARKILPNKLSDSSKKKLPTPQKKLSYRDKTIRGIEELFENPPWSQIVNYGLTGLKDRFCSVTDLGSNDEVSAYEEEFAKCHNELLDMCSTSLIPTEEARRKVRRLAGTMEEMKNMAGARSLEVLFDTVVSFFMKQDPRFSLGSLISGLQKNGR